MDPHVNQQEKYERKHGRLSSVFQSFGYRDYRWLWLGTFFSFMAVGMQQVTRGWLVLRLTDDSPFALALVMMSFALPLTFASILGGVLADRIPRRQIILLSQGGNMILTLFLATLDMTGIILFWHLLVIGFCNGTLAAFNMPSRQSITSDIVPGETLMNAISLNSAGMNITRIIGPALAGVLIIYMDTAGVFYLIALFHAFSVLCTTLIKEGRTQSKDSPGKGIFTDIREGFQYAVGNPILLGLVIMNFVPALFGFPYLTLLPAWGREVLNIQSDGLGILMTCVGIGSLIGVMGLASLYHLKRRRALLVALAFLWGTALILFSRCASYTTAVPTLMIIGVLSAVFMSLNMTLMQSYSSHEMRGRIVSMGMMTFGVMPLSAVPFGALAEGIGTADSLGIAGLLLCLFTIVFFLAFPRFRKVS
ncbi:MAG TPA: MFS transporter [Syntrophales bacterium]|nr:MFS transporter [Syntrophales bacterium]HPQ43853.1 MFS transporter [Syntrophales bacterium]